MGWIESLRGGMIGLDTAPLIYFIETHPRYMPLVRPFFEALDRGEFTVVTLTNVSAEVAEEAARIRAAFNVRTPDAIQLATAIRAGAGYFLTNDMKLPALPGMQVIVLERVAGPASP
jgi:predicted nucleic acid-binding protein